MDAVKRFFSSPRFAVAGASNDPAKFGFKSASPSQILSTSIFCIKELAFSSPRMVSPTLAAGDPIKPASTADQPPLTCVRHRPLAE
jgi:hypothetical protein